MNVRILALVLLVMVAVLFAFHLEDLVILCQSILPHWMNAALDRFLDWLLNDLLGAGGWDRPEWAE